MTDYDVRTVCYDRSKIGLKIEKKIMIHVFLQHDMLQSIL